MLFENESLIPGGRTNFARMGGFVGGRLTSQYHDAWHQDSLTTNPRNRLYWLTVKQPRLPTAPYNSMRAIKSRAYTPEQIDLIVRAQSEKYRLATQLAYAAGLRAHELFTLQRVADRQASTHRTWSP